MNAENKNENLKASRNVYDAEASNFNRTIIEHVGRRVLSFKRTIFIFLRHFLHSFIPLPIHLYSKNNETTILHIFKLRMMKRLHKTYIFLYFLTIRFSKSQIVEGKVEIVEDFSRSLSLRGLHQGFLRTNLLPGIDEHKKEDTFLIPLWNSL